MSYLVLARKYRPTRFEDVIGQEAIAETLKRAIESGRVAHAYLFAGQRGVGKTTMARILAAALNCQTGPTPAPCGVCGSCEAVARGEDLDVLEIDGASNTGVDNIRDLRTNARYTPARSRFKIYYVDEVHMLSKSAFNALLKTLEEPPEHVKFIFSTTEPHRIPDTIHSRCQRFDFRSIPPKAIADQLARILQAEGITGSPEVLASLARRSRGSLRDALSLLDQLISATGSAADLAALERLLGLADRSQIEAMGAAIARRDPAAALAVVERLVEDGRSLGEFLNGFIEYGREALLIAVCGGQTDLVASRDAARAAAAELARALGPETLLYAIQLLTETLRRLSRASDERLPVEMAVVKLCTGDPLVPLSELVSKLERLEGPDVGGEPRRPAAGPAGGSGRPPDRPSGRGGPPRAVDLPPAADRPPANRLEAATGGGPPPRRPPGAGNPQWEATLQAVQETRRRIAALLREGTILALDQDTLLLGFAPERRVFVEQLNDPETRAFIERHAAQAFGRGIQLQFAIAEPKMKDNREGKTQVEEASEPAPGAEAQGHPAVRAAMDLFGARVVRVRRPAVEEFPAEEAAPD